MDNGVQDIELAPWSLAALRHDVINELSHNMQIYCSNTRPLSIPLSIRGIFSLAHLTKLVGMFGLVK